jgi:uncharacterized protein (TIGR02145 family)
MMSFSDKCIAIILILFSLSACEKSEPDKILVVSTDDVEIFSEGIYIFKGSITGVGEGEVTEHGFCWAMTENPVMDVNSIRLGAVKSEGSFNYTEYNVYANTTYYVRAFAEAGSDFYYGEEKSFTTPEKLTPFVIDIDQNIYYTVDIGGQTWMSDNLKATRYSDGSQIPRVEDRITWFNFTMYTQAYCWYENFSAIGATYGALYTWPAAMRITSESDIKPGTVQGVCPDGWHLPGDSEWQQLERYLGMSQAAADTEEWRGEDEGGMLKKTGNTEWASPNTGATDESGFRAIPAGWRDGSGYFKNLGSATRFWTSSKRGDYAWMRELDNNLSKIYRGTKGLYEGYSVRCIKDK